MGRTAIRYRSSLAPNRCRSGAPRGIDPNFSGLSPCNGQVLYALLTRAPVAGGASTPMPLDLHVLGLPLAFILSQDQTLHRCFSNYFDPPQKSDRRPVSSFFFLAPRPGSGGGRCLYNMSMNFLILFDLPHRSLSGRKSTTLFRTGKLFKEKNFFSLFCAALTLYGYLRQTPRNIATAPFSGCKSTGLFRKNKPFPKVFLGFFQDRAQRTGKEKLEGRKKLPKIQEHKKLP